MKILKDLLWSERGEIGETGDTDAAPEQSVGTVETVDNVDHDLSPAQDDTAVQPDQTPQGQRDDFLATEENLDPRKLDPALQPIFKRMQGVYTKRMQEIAEIRDRAQQVDRFYNDRDFAQQTLVQWAAQNGYQLTPINGQAQGQRIQPQHQGDAPTFLVEQFKANLQPELQWMAEPLAKAMQASMQGMLQPVLQQHEQQTKAQRASEWDKYANDLGEVAPGWEEHEGAMGDLYDFLRSDSLHHPTYGSKIQMLYDLATARAASLKQAQQRVASAGKNRVTTSRPTGQRPASVEDEILKANTQDAWALAKKNALAQHKKSTT